MIARFCGVMVIIGGVAVGVARHNVTLCVVCCAVGLTLYFAGRSA